MAKSIILFSDGTGNSSAKLFKTNVWRTYQAVDLGPSAEGKRDQISDHDDGVGTSSFKPLTVLGGAFGWGLQRNVLEIYRYACRNYRTDDDIYAFGFSRGAFTVRVVAALIASEGLVRSSSEAELDRKSRHAYRNFRAAFLPRRLEWPTRLSRRVRGVIDHWIGRLRGYEPYDPADNCWPKIRFLGVWDTVSAYGGPITEITRAIDNWIYPLSMPNYQLNEHVQCARHALAIDDERDAFQPLLWDEVHERRLIDDNKVEEGRLAQVWFTGMHADVGGGYPDESLSYISLLWMLEEAEKAGLRTLKVIKDVFVALASSYGPIHDSRAGLAAYYRYQPRKLAAWLDPVDPATLSLRDPAITDSDGKSRGLLCAVHVHESVINRIATGTDRYAPITLPQTFFIVPPQVAGETAPQSDNQTGDPAAASTTPTSILSGELRARLTAPASSLARAEATEPIWNYVWWRRLTYFATVFATLLLLSLPFAADRLPRPPILADGRTWIGGVIRLLTLFLPAFAGDWIKVYADNPFYFFVLGGVTFLLLKFGTRLERSLRDEARAMWKGATGDGPLPRRRVTWIQKFRNDRRYQRFIQIFKWNFLPDAIVTPVFVALMLWIGLAVYAQTALPVFENRASLCRPSAGGGREITTPVSRDFSTRDVCSESFGGIVEAQRYIVTFDVVEPWADGNIPTNPEGLALGDFPWGRGYLAAPFRRVIDARFLQPVLEIRRSNGKRHWGNVQIYPLSVRQVGDVPSMYRAEFTAQRSGELFVFANDAMIPVAGNGWRTYGSGYFYQSSGSRGNGAKDERGNHGTACVTVAGASVTQQPGGVPATAPICRQAAERNKAELGAAQTARDAGRSRP